jgi:hypothetical protein
MKRNWLNWAVGGFLVLGASSCSTTGGHKQTIELFNHKDLAGWQQVLADPAVKMSQVWSVQDGILVCQGTPLGFLYRGPEATNFRLVVEYRWLQPTGSGVWRWICVVAATPESLRMLGHRLRIVEGPSGVADATQPVRGWGGPWAEAARLPSSHRYAVAAGHPQRV